MKKLLFAYILLLLPFIGVGQETVTTVGECPVTKKITYQEAVEIALENAKREAVYAVCGTEVSTFSLIRTVNEDRDYASRIMSNAHGVVRVLDKHTTYNGSRVKVTITGEVYDVSGPRYLNVSGMLDVYNMDQNISFDIRFNNPCYLKVFWLDDQTGSGGILYDGARKFNTSQYPIRFPDACDCVNYKKVICPFLKTKDEIMRDWCMNHVYYGTPKSTGEDKYVTVVFVATNSNVPYVENYVNEENFLRWWCSLPCDERAGLERKSFIIKL